MKLRILGILAAAVFASAGLAQTTPTRDDIELTRVAIQAKRQELVTNAIYLTDAEGQKFWPLYRDWRAKMAGLGDRKVNIVQRVSEGFDDLSGEEAKQMVDEWLRLETEELKLKKNYLKRFRKILPEKKVARFFQLENKMDAILYYDLVERVPLVE